MHVQKRFEEVTGPARQHLISHLLHVEVTRGISGPDAVLDGLISSTVDNATTMVMQTEASETRTSLTLVYVHAACSCTARRGLLVSVIVYDV